MSTWNLRQLMADRNLTNEDVAAIVRRQTGKDTHWTTISRWKQYDVMPPIGGEILDALCLALTCKRDDLLGKE